MWDSVSLPASPCTIWYPEGGGDCFVGIDVVWALPNMSCRFEG